MNTAIDAAMNTIEDPKREMLRHTIATVAYRGSKSVSNAPEGFAAFRVNETTRTPGEILAHMSDVLDWALRAVKGENVYNEFAPRSWEEEATRFFASLKAFDDYLASDAPLVDYTAEKIFQGPIADVLAHIGQIMLLRRMAGSPVRAEIYPMAEIMIGRVGREQSAERVEFD